MGSPLCPPNAVSLTVSGRKFPTSLPSDPGHGLTDFRTKWFSIPPTGESINKPQSPLCGERVGACSWLRKRLTHQLHHGGVAGGRQDKETLRGFEPLGMKISPPDISPGRNGPRQILLPHGHSLSPPTTWPASAPSDSRGFQRAWVAVGIGVGTLDSQDTGALCEETCVPDTHSVSAPNVLPIQPLLSAPGVTSETDIYLQDPISSFLLMLLHPGLSTRLSTDLKPSNLVSFSP